MKDGLIHIYHGNGKGKTTAAMGLSVRAVSYGNNVCVCQFLKSGKTGEEDSLKKLGVTFMKDNSNKKFLWNMTDEEKDNYKKTQNILLKELLTNINGYDLIVLDEVLDAINSKIIDEKEILEILKNKDSKQEFVLTGRNPSDSIIAISDYISNIVCEKHPYQNGVSARKGIEF